MHLTKFRKSEKQTKITTTTTKNTQNLTKNYKNNKKKLFLTSLRKLAAAELLSVVLFYKTKQFLCILIPLIELKYQNVPSKKFEVC